MEDGKPSAEDLESVRRAQDYAQKMLNRAGEDEVSMIDFVNGCMHAIHAVCGASEDLGLGQQVAPFVTRLALQVNGESVARECLAAKLQVIAAAPPREDDDGELPPNVTPIKKPHVH